MRREFLPESVFVCVPRHRRLADAAALAVIGGVPLVGGLATLVVGLWSLAAFVVAARQALDVSTGRAVWVCFLAVLVNAACVFGLMLLLGGPGGAGTAGAIG